MKMSKEHFNELCGAIDEVLQRHSLPQILKHRETIKFVKSQFVSFCLSIFHASKFDCKELYSAGLNDSHIETALKRILSDFE